MTTKSANPAHPDAHPTAPGGMSRKALIAELISEHNYEGPASAWADVSWPTLIELVIEARAEAEAEADEDTEGDLVPEGWDNDVQPVNPDNYGDYAGEGEPYVSTEADEDAMVDAVIEALEDAESNEMDIDTEAAARNTSVEVVTELHDATALFADEGPDPMIDEAGELLDVLMPLLEDIAADLPPDVAIDSEGIWDDGFEVDLSVEMGKAIADEDGVLDPEVLFAEMAAARAEATPPPVFLGIPGVKDYIFEGHAGAGPSGAERWMNCTMSLSASRAFLETLTPNQQAEYAKASTAARQGTTAHAVGEVEANLVLGRVSQEEVDYTLLELTVEPEEGEQYTDEMAEYVAEYVDLIKSYAQERGDDHVLIEAVVEADIPLTDLHEGEVYVIRGKGDAVILPVKPVKGKRVKAEDRTLVVGDLKYGNGLDVDVDENPQIRLYALGILALLVDPETGELPAWIKDVVYHIIQPRLGGIKTWTESIDDLLAWRDEVLAPRLTKALYGANEGATFEPSALACQWCPARGRCPALAEQRMAEGAELFEAVLDAEFEHGPGSVPDPVSMSDTRLGELLTQAKAIKDLYSDLREEAQRRLHRGEDVPGFWLVNYSPNRQWSEDMADDPVTALEDAGLNTTQIAQMFTEPTLLSPPAAEKVLDKETFPKIANLVVKPDKRPVISTGAGDKRSRWEGKPPEAMFADESDTEA